MRERFDAYGWAVDDVGEVANDLEALEAALVRAKAEEERPSLIILRSHIGYPSPHLTDTANVLIMPAMHSAQISTKLLQQLGAVNVMGPLLVGLEKSVQIAPLGAKMSEIYSAAVIAARLMACPPASALAAVPMPVTAIVSRHGTA